MQRFLRAALLTSFLVFNSFARAETEEADDPTYLDGYVGAGAAFLGNMSSDEKGSRQNFRLEFARVRKWISLDARVGIGQDYSDYGALFRVYKHWKFGPESTTGLSFGVGLGAMYSQGVSPLAGETKKAFFDVIGAPFTRFIWDWGNGVGLGVDLEYQLVPLTSYTNDTETDTVDDRHDLRHRIFVGLSLLFEVD